MSIICQCPAATAITSPGNVSCAENFGQIQKVAFTRLKQADGTLNGFSSTNAISLKTSWTTFLAAIDGTKIVITPYLNAPADSGGDARMSSGGNDDLGGIAEVLGGNPVQFNAEMRSVPQTVAAALKELSCEANAGNLGVYLFDENGRIEALTDPNTPTTHRPIPVRGFFVSDKIHGNYDAKDHNLIQWSYAEGYSNRLVIVTPSDFNPLTDLQNSANS